MAALGISVGDFVSVGTLAWKVYRACKSASAEFEEVSREVITLHAAIKELEDEAANEHSLLKNASPSKGEELDLLIKNIRAVLSQLEQLVTKYQSLSTRHRKKWDIFKFGKEGLNEIRSKIVFHTSAINLFLTGLSTESLARIERRLDEIVKEFQRGNRDASSVAHLDEDVPEAEVQWQALKKDLVDDGFTKQDIESHKDWIKARLREIMDNSKSEDTLAETSDAQAPGRSTETGTERPVSQTAMSSLVRAASMTSPEPHRQLQSPDTVSAGPETSPLRRIGSAASLANSIHSDVLEYDSYGQVKRRTVSMTTTYTNNSRSGSVFSLATSPYTRDHSYAQPQPSLADNAATREAVTQAQLRRRNGVLNKRLEQVCRYLAHTLHLLHGSGISSRPLRVFVPPSLEEFASDNEHFVSDDSGHRLQNFTYREFEQELQKMEQRVTALHSSASPTSPVDHSKIEPGKQWTSTMDSGEQAGQGIKKEYDCEAPEEPHRQYAPGNLAALEEENRKLIEGYRLEIMRRQLRETMS